MYVLEWMAANDSGKLISTGFYGGPNPKYYSLINITIKECAKKFESYQEAADTVARLNKVGYNFVVREI